VCWALSLVIKAILWHVGLWEKESQPLPKNSAPSADYPMADQILSYDYADPDYPFEAYLKKFVQCLSNLKQTAGSILLFCYIVASDF
jgi:hypothetical protein